MSIRIIDMTEDQLRTLVREEVRSTLDAHERASTVKYLTCEETAAILRIHPKVVVRWVQKRGLPARKVGRDWRFTRTEIDKWIAEQGGEDALRKGKRAA